MPLRLIEMVVPQRQTGVIVDLARALNVVDVWYGAVTEERQTIKLLVGPQNRQDVLDKLQAALSAAEDWRIVVQPVDATVPEVAQSDQQQQQVTTQTREELYHRVAGDAKTTPSYLVMVALSALIATAGLLNDNVAVIIGAMVIAPLLSPNIAFTLGAALGDHRLMLQAAGTALAGLAVAVGLGAAIGLILDIDPSGDELQARSLVSLDGAAIALGSGAAAALSVTSGVSSALVGVMVAVALMPPAAALGIFLGAGQMTMAGGAALLLTVNIVCVNLAGQGVMLISGVKPRSWAELENAKQSVRWSILVWTVGLSALIALMLLRSG